MPLLLLAAGALVLGALGIGVATGNIAKKPFEDLQQQIRGAMGGAAGGVGTGGKTRGYPSFWGGEGMGGGPPPQTTMPPIPATVEPTVTPAAPVTAPPAMPQSSFDPTPATPPGTPDWSLYTAPSQRIDTSQDASNLLAGIPGADAAGNPGMWTNVNGTPVFTPAK